MRRNIIIIALVLGAIAFVAFTLKNNKHEMNEKAKLGLVTSQSIPVEMTQAKMGIIDASFHINGAFSPISELTLVSETQGTVTRVLKRKGSYVHKGELLATIDNELARADQMAAQAQHDKMKADAGRFANLKETEAVTARQLEDVKLGLKNAEAQLKAANKRLENTFIKAPISGMINESYIQQGAYLAPGMKMYDIVDVKKLTIDVKLTESEIIKVKKGQEVGIAAQVYPGKEYNGKISAIAAKADQSLKYEVEIEFTNPADTPLKAGMYGTAHFKFKGQKEALLIEREAIVGGLKDPQVYMVKDGKASLRPIAIGQVYRHQVEIVQGLQEGDKVVGKGMINLQEGTPVSVR